MNTISSLLSPQTSRAARAQERDASSSEPAAGCSDRALLEAGAAGDRSALEQLLQRYQSPLYAFCRGLLHRSEDAEDAVQETFLRALRGLGRFRREASPRTWLYRIAVNVCLEWKRSRRSAETREERWQREQPDELCPESEAMRRLLILRALEMVQPRQRAILILRADGWEVAEIASVLGWPSARVYYELRKAHRALAEWEKSEGADR